MKKIRVSFILACFNLFAQENLDLKKGVAFNLGYENSWQERFEKLKPHWHYSWHWEYRNNYPDEIEFVPMIWGSDNATQDKIDYLNNLVSLGKIQNVLMFNEPDLKSQSNMSVTEVVDLWPLIETLNVPISSPVTSAPLNDWMRNFMQVANSQNLRIDFVAIHIYHKNNPTEFIELIEEVYQTYGKPIWITEFAVRDTNATINNTNIYSESYVLAFMENVLNELHKLDYVKRYSWFDPNANNEKYPRLQTADIINENNQLTTLGEYYANQNPNNNLSNYNQQLDELTIYPNPSKNLIFISKYFSDLTASIYDLNGKILSKEIAKSEIDLSQLKKGVYFIKFSNQKNELVHKLIVKK
jgi:hypothetical protein|tara:strand:- start:5885 stop:6952 length:1068 start_codon:yes stop_codon:yes gene_type:complete